MTTGPLVSVVMSVYNSAGTLAATMDSVLTQQGVSFEFIIIDDGSTDGSGAILDDYTRRDDRIRVIHQANTGLTRALIRGCAAARGNYIARQDAGDASLPGRLARQVALLNDRPSAVFVTCGYDLVGPAGELLTRVPPPAEATAARWLTNTDPEALRGPHHGTVMFRRESYHRAGGYRPAYYYAQDLDLWTRLIALGDLAVVPDTLYRVAFTYDSITARHRQRQDQLRRLIAEAGALRLSGGDEAPVLAKAARIGADRGPLDPGRRAAAAYFIGSCLADRRDARARGYLIDAVKQHPFHLKAWFKLFRSLGFSAAGKGTMAS